MNAKKVINLYQVLEISPDSSLEEIKAAYRRLAKKYHPDKFKNGQDKIDSAEQFKLIKEAYDYLMISKKMMIYKDEYDSFEEKIHRAYENNRNYSEAGELTEQQNFLKYYLNQVNIDNNTASKPKPKTKNKKFVELEKYFWDNHLTKIDVFEHIYKQKPIVILNETVADTDDYNTLLIQETQFVSAAKATKDYELYSNQYKFYKKLNVEAVLKIYSNHESKIFDHDIAYQIKVLCSKCHGTGCKSCSHGHKLVEKITRVQIPIDHNETKMQYEIEDAGNIGSLAAGKLIITVLYQKKSSPDPQASFVFSTSNQLSVILQPIVEFKEITEAKLAPLWKTIMDNKHYSLLYGLIAILILIIILVLVL